MTSLHRSTSLAAALVAFVLLLGACTPVHVLFLAQDSWGGRVPGTAGHSSAQNYLTGYLRAHGAEALDGTTDTAAYLAPYASGTNVVARIPGTDLSDEIVLVGAHFDHVANCADKGGNSVCNGATDNAAGSAIVLEIAAAIFDSGAAPRRTVMFAFWDEEERGLIGSREWIAANPTVVDDVVAYVNYDIAGANLLPSLANDTLAVGAESGGSSLSVAVAAAGAVAPVDVNLLSLVFGQGRSDHANFFNASVPTVFFTDATGPCYHTNADTFAVLDGEKLQEQRDIGVALVTDLAAGSVSPTFDGTAPLASYADALVIHSLLTSGLADTDLFSPADAAAIVDLQSTLDAIVTAGEAAFDASAQTSLLVSSLTMVNILTHGDCDGFLD